MPYSTRRPLVFSIGLALITLLVGTIGCQSPKVVPAQSGDQPIIISDGSLSIKSSKAFNSWPNDNTNQPNEIYPQYGTFNGADVLVDGQLKPGCAANKACVIDIRYEDANKDTIHFKFDPNGKHKLVLSSDVNSFDTYRDFSNGKTVIYHPMDVKIKKVTTSDGAEYTPGSGCTITIHLQ